jgi:cell division protein FtsI/penicillin-binding protein 2
MANNRLISQPNNRGLLRDIVGAIGLIAVTVLIILAIIFAVSLKHDLKTIKGANQQLLAQVQQQQRISQQQLEVSKAMYDVTKQQLQVNQNVYELTNEQLGISRAMDTKLSSSLSLQQQLLGVAQQTLQQARDINRKMPPQVPASNLGL